MKKTLVLTGMVVLVGTMALACSEEKAGLGGSCSKDGDCKSGLVCRSGVCVESSGECDPPCDPATQACFQGECVPVGDPSDRDGDGSPVSVDCDESNHEIHPGATEYCDGVDNNCDTNTDEGCPPCTENESRDCGTDLGLCIPGVQNCQGGTWSVCSGTGPSPERCDGEDNDCDGMVDEICPCEDEEEMDCGSIVGACMQGVQRCNNGEWTGCWGGTLPVPEVCDGLDNDCDGLTDEGFVFLCGCSDNSDCAAGELCIDDRCQRQEFLCLTAGGGSISSSNYDLEVFVAPMQPVGETSGQSYDTRLGPGAIRGSR
jgi:hypothetical protein